MDILYFFAHMAMDIFLIWFGIQILKNTLKKEKNDLRVKDEFNNKI